MIFHVYFHMSPQIKSCHACRPARSTSACTPPNTGRGACTILHFKMCSAEPFKSCRSSSISSLPDNLASLDRSGDSPSLVSGGPINSKIFNWRVLPGPRSSTFSDYSENPSFHVSCAGPGHSHLTHHLTHPGQWGRDQVRQTIVLKILLMTKQKNHFQLFN